MIDAILNSLEMLDEADFSSEMDTNINVGINNLTTEASLFSSDSIDLEPMNQQTLLGDNSLDMDGLCFTVDETDGMSSINHFNEQLVEKQMLSNDTDEIACIEPTTNEFENTLFGLNEHTNVAAGYENSSIDIDNLINTPTLDNPKQLSFERSDLSLSNSFEENGWGQMDSPISFGNRWDVHTEEFVKLMNKYHIDIPSSVNHSNQYDVVEMDRNTSGGMMSVDKSICKMRIEDALKNEKITKEQYNELINKLSSC